MRKAIAAGNIQRDSWPVSMPEHVNLYLGSGRMGSCFDAYGMMGDLAPAGKPLKAIAKTHIMHAEHWHRGDYGLDYWLPVARLIWSKEPPKPEQYSQSLDIVAGALTTKMRSEGLSISLKAFYNPERRDILAVELRYEAAQGKEMPGLELRPMTSVDTHYNQHLEGSFKTLKTGDASIWAARLRVGSADSVCALRTVSSHGAASISNGKEGAKVSFEGSSGRHLLLVSVAGTKRSDEAMEELKSIGSPEEYAAEAAQAWHKRYGDAYIELPVPEYQAIWARSLFYVLSSYAPDMRSPAAPMGWAGSGWPFHFPQDLSYIHPALLRLGHYDIAKSWVEFYRSYLEETRKVTKRIYKADGALWAWEHPIGPDTKMLADSSPNCYQYEIHNAAYPARMAYETSMHINDEAWSKEVAWPVVAESARFFSSVAKREKDGLWSIHVKPSMGQDELGGQDAKNYLCALFSARYTMSTALEMAGSLGVDDEDLATWRRILSDGLAFEHLIDEKTGRLRTNENVKSEKLWGTEKHPIQLNPLIFLPTGDLEPHVVKAYETRYEVCAGVKDKFYHGWTLAAFLLGASHIGDSEGLLKELAATIPGRYADPDWIQIYESSGSKGAPFYVTSHGLYLQALNDALVSDYFGAAEIGKACPDSWLEASFRNLRVRGGKRLSGRKEGKDWKYSIE